MLVPTLVDYQAVGRKLTIGDCALRSTKRGMDDGV